MVCPRNGPTVASGKDVVTVVSHVVVVVRVAVSAFSIHPPRVPRVVVVLDSSHLHMYHGPRPFESIQLIEWSPWLLLALLTLGLSCFVSVDWLLRKLD